MALACRNTLANYSRLGIATKVYHFGTRVGLLVVVGEGYAVKLADAVVALEDAAGVLPSNGAAGLHLGPANLGVGLADSALGYKIVHATLALGIARVPVLHRGVLNLGVIQGNQLYHGGMKLVLVSLRGGAALEVAYKTAFICHQ